MPPTERLYYDDSHLIEFEARVIDKSERVSGWTAITLDRTAFYPTGGGQPSDTGTLNGARVVECVEDEGMVLHVVQGRAPEIGAVVRGRIDWARRLDHIQQHTGQHLLSQAFIKLYNAPTHSFRVLEHSSEIDIDLANPSDETIERAIRLANNVIWEDRSINIRQVTPEEAAELPLRRDSAREGELLRVIEIEDFDLTPCGGTHAYRTGEVGIIAVRSWQRAKGLTRIEFVAGGRALTDYNRANHTARSVAALFSAGRDDAPELTARLLKENKELHHRVRALEEIAARVEAAELLANARPGPDNSRIVTATFADRDAESLKRLALALMSQPKTIVLLGSQDKETARLVFARSKDSPGDMNHLMRTACEPLEGRGGGKPDLAQGGGKNFAKIKEALAIAEQGLVKPCD
ncbi:MAG TPA: DHHA1 domain-containing protein [Pyrinomonadaceae bacterium]|nr:DHHA1 domain-containing protein [Pyrinomonadaceae bacterium]